MSAKRSHSRNTEIWTKIPYESAKECVVLTSKTFDEKNTTKTKVWYVDTLMINRVTSNFEESGQSSLHKIEKKECRDNFQRFLLGTSTRRFKTGRAPKVLASYLLYTSVPCCTATRLKSTWNTEVLNTSQRVQKTTNKKVIRTRRVPLIKTLDFYSVFYFNSESMIQDFTFVHRSIR